METHEDDEKHLFVDSLLLCHLPCSGASGFGVWGGKDGKVPINMRIKLKDTPIVWEFLIAHGGHNLMSIPRVREGLSSYGLVAEANIEYVTISCDTCKRRGVKIGDFIDLEQ